MIGSDISLTFLLIFHLCSNCETGPNCTCRSTNLVQSVHKRLKETKDNPFEFSGHGGYLCVPAQQYCTSYFCAATISTLLYCQCRQKNKKTLQVKEGQSSHIETSPACTFAWLGMSWAVPLTPYLQDSNPVP